MVTAVRKGEHMPSWIGPWEIIIVVIIALLVFGPRRLPELGSSIGKAITGFRKGLKEGEDEIRKAVSHGDEAQEPPAASPGVAAITTKEDEKP